MAKHLSEVRTEDTILDLLRIQGWRTDKVPKGSLIRQNEYKNFPSLLSRPALRLKLPAAVHANHAEATCLGRYQAS